MPRKCLVNVVVLILGIFQIRTREVRNFSDVHFNSTFLKVVETASQPTKELSIISLTSAVVDRTREYLIGVYIVVVVETQLNPNLVDVPMEYFDFAPPEILPLQMTCI